MLLYCDSRIFGRLPLKVELRYRFEVGSVESLEELEPFLRAIGEGDFLVLVLKHREFLIACNEIDEMKLASEYVFKF